MYYNTTNQSGSTLTEYITTANSQDDMILNWFRFWPSCAFTPFDVQKALNLMNTPITSIRRSITDLTNEGKLIKLESTVPGLYNRPNHQWRLA